MSKKGTIADSLNTFLADGGYKLERFEHSQYLDGERHTVHTFSYRFVKKPEAEPDQPIIVSPDDPK